MGTIITHPSTRPAQLDMYRQVQFTEVSGTVYKPFERLRNYFHAKLIGRLQSKSF